MKKITNKIKGQYTKSQGKKIQVMAGQAFSLLYSGVEVELVKGTCGMDDRDNYMLVAVNADGCRFERVIIAEYEITKRGRVSRKSHPIHTLSELQKL